MMTTEKSAVPPVSSTTVDFYARLQWAFDHFNAQLFEDKLPPCLITLRSSDRYHGYHHKDRFVNKQGQTLDELGLHPGFFTVQPIEEVLSTLVHEMVHHWQDGFGTPTKTNPHNREWGQKMRELGLEPTSTGLPGGKEVGHSMSHYIVPMGSFLSSCRALLAQGFDLQWFDRHVPRDVTAAPNRQSALAAVGVALELSTAPVQEIAPLPQGKPVVVTPPPKREVDRVKYACTSCTVKAWAAAHTALECGACNRPLVPADVDANMTASTN